MSESGAILFLGESALVDPLVHAFAAKTIPESARSLDFEIVRLGERSLDDLACSLRQVGMFAARRCVWLRGLAVARGGGESEDESPTPADGDHAALLAILEEGLAPGLTLVVSTSSLDARGRLYKWFAKNGEVRDLRIELDRRGRLEGDRLHEAIAARLSAAGVRAIDRGAIEEIARRAGPSVGELMQEVDRLALALVDPSRIGVDDVRGSMRDLGHAWVFELTDAIGARRLGDAERIVDRLLAEGESPIRLVALLAGHVASLLEVHPTAKTLADRVWTLRGRDALEAIAGAAPPALKRRYPAWRGYFLMRAARAFTDAELRRFHASVVDLDLALKSSRVSPLLLLSRALQGACVVAPTGRAAERRSGPASSVSPSRPARGPASRPG